MKADVWYSRNIYIWNIYTIIYIYDDFLWFWVARCFIRSNKTPERSNFFARIACALRLPFGLLLLLLLLVCMGSDRNAAIWILLRARQMRLYVYFCH